MVNQGWGGVGRAIQKIFDTGLFAGMGERPLASVTLDEAKDKITFAFQDGGSVAFGVEGDCCSSSWIEHLTVPDDLAGAILTDVSDGDGVPWDGHECDTSKGWDKPCGHDVLAVYNTKFRSTKGDIVLEYRNDSNGYYGGYLVRLADAR